MNKLVIYVFSGTGNTMKCAEYLQQKLTEMGVRSDLHNIEQITVMDPEADMVICYPVHGFNAPEFMVRFCKGLPEGNSSVWFLKTSGEPLKLNDNSSAQLAHILRRKGYSIKGEFHYVMPYNMIFRHSDEMATLMWETAKTRIPEAARQIAAGTEVQIHSPLSAKVMSWLCRIEHPFFPVNGRLFHVDMDSCLRCMRCVKACPTKNISYEEDAFHFGGSCTECARCSFECPAAAIHIGILDFMRVNGEYAFDSDPSEAEIGWYCHDSYTEYFQL